MTATPEQLRLQEIVDEAKRLIVYPGISWEEEVWDISEAEQRRAHKKSRVVLLFTCYRPDHTAPLVPFKQPFADFAKAVIRMRASSRSAKYSSQHHVILASRFLYQSLIRTKTADPTRLTRKHFQQAITAIHQAYSYGAAYSLGGYLQEIALFLDDHQLCRTRINFRNPLKSPGRGDSLDRESQARGLAKLPSREALEALSRISTHPENDEERILLRIIELHLAGGFRIGEGLTLPLDCWIEEPALDQTGKPKIDPSTKAPIKRCGLRYWPEKGGDPIVKWLPDHAVPLAKRAIVDLTRLCAPARAAAAVLERHRDRVPLPGEHHSDELLDGSQLARILGVQSDRHARGFLRQILKIEPAFTKKTGNTTRFLYRVGDIEAALVGRRGQLEVVRRPDRRFQMLSESLCVVFYNQFNPRRATLTFLAQLVSYPQITAPLGGSVNKTSLFTRRGFTEADGSPIRIKTHAFRHWLNTMAERGGLSDIELALWMGRRDTRDNESYKHGTVAQRVARAQEMIKDGRLHGPVSETYQAINDPVEKRAFLEAFVSVVHFTPFGVCLHDFALEPCKYHLNCLSGCAEYLRTKGDPGERKNIVELRDFHLIQLKSYTKAAEDGTLGAGNWASHAERIIEGANAALAVDDQSSGDGALVPVFPAGQSRGKPIT